MKNYRLDILTRATMLGLTLDEDEVEILNARVNDNVRNGSHKSDALDMIYFHLKNKYGDKKEDLEQNYLRPWDLKHKDSLEDHIFCNRIFVKALSYLLKEKGEKENEQNEGIIIDLDGNKYMVFHDADDKQIKINKLDDVNHPEGTMLWVHGQE